MSEEQQGAVEAPTFDRTAAESKAAEGLSALFGEEADTATDTRDDAADETADASPEPVAETVEDKDAEKEEVTTEEEEVVTEDVKEEKEAAPATAKKVNGPTLPDAYRRTLKAYEWTDEEIDANLASMGGKFIETAAKMHMNRNKEVADWAAAGRAARGENVQQQEQPAAKPAAELKPLDVAKLKEKYGDDELLREVIGPVNTVIEQIKMMLPQIEQHQTRAKQAELEMLGKQIDGFFGSKAMESYREQFGNGDTLTDAQVKSREKVLEMADALIVGAGKQGRRIGFNEAMTLALDSSTGPLKEKAAVAKVKQSLKERQKGISLKPGTRKAAGTPSKNPREALESRVSSKLAAAFGGR